MSFMAYRTTRGSSSNCGSLVRPILSKETKSPVHRHSFQRLLWWNSSKGQFGCIKELRNGIRNAFLVCDPILFPRLFCCNFAAKSSTCCKTAAKCCNKYYGQIGHSKCCKLLHFELLLQNCSNINRGKEGSHTGNTLAGWNLSIRYPKIFDIMCRKYLLNISYKRCSSYSLMHLLNYFQKHNFFSSTI